MGVSYRRVPGSSPRGRGKRRTHEPPRRRRGLIPAWAGKTGRACGRASRPWAHPRVGGENTVSHIPSCIALGSSPRGRGKPRRRPRRPDASRLIPAWAGKTGALATTCGAVPAHPRVGGENAVIDEPHEDDDGSSPRGRGKLLDERAGHVAYRLIPAWAGKTTPCPAPVTWAWAHPRVGGENSCVSAGRKS